MEIRSDAALAARGAAGGCRDAGPGKGSAAVGDPRRETRHAGPPARRAAILSRMARAHAHSVSGHGFGRNSEGGGDAAGPQFMTLPARNRGYPARDTDQIVGPETSLRPIFPNRTLERPNRSVNSTSTCLKVVDTFRACCLPC